MNIQEYIEYIKTTDPMAKKLDYRWDQTLDKMSYSNVLLGTQGHYLWPEVHQWCKEQFGEEHYTWTGSIFWFDNTENALQFALKWS